MSRNRRELIAWATGYEAGLREGKLQAFAAVLDEAEAQLRTKVREIAPSGPQKPFKATERVN